MSQSSGLGYSQARRPLFLPQELMDFRAGSGLLWPAGTSKSVPFSAPSYWDVPEFNARAGSNPYYAGDTAAPQPASDVPVSADSMRAFVDRALKAGAEAIRIIRNG